MSALISTLSKLQISDDTAPNLDTLPPTTWATIFSYVTSAQTVAHVALTCRKLEAVVRAQGWRAFVRNRFSTLDLPKRLEDAAWMELAKKLTWQSRAWDQRAFTVTSDVPSNQWEGDIRGNNRQTHPGRRGGRARGRGRGHGRHSQEGPHVRPQTFPAHIVVSASSKCEGQHEEETVAWGFGEDVVIRSRLFNKSMPQGENWTSLPGAAGGFKAGTDDVTAVSILDSTAAQPGLLVGRGSGYMQLLSMDSQDIGKPLAWFQPLFHDGEQPIQQVDIQQFDTNQSKDAVAVVTKKSINFYSLVPNTWSAADPRIGTSEPVVEPMEALSIGDMADSQDFRHLREAKFMENGDVALCMSSSTEPLRYLQRTPAGTILVNACKMQPSHRSTASYIFDTSTSQTARNLLPMSTRSIVGGSGATVLSSYDDGTIRLQDMRSASPFDAIFQDHFEVTTPVGPLLAYGMERFIVGSARTPILKIFDFRWTKRYSYIDALDCSTNPLGPPPKALTGMPLPMASGRSKCCAFSREQCDLHALASTDFYRPNCNIYLPVATLNKSPIYSLAKASDTASTIYAGLTGELISMNLADGSADLAEQSYMKMVGAGSRCGYKYHHNHISMVETGDGLALSDISQSSRLPLLFKQKGGGAMVDDVSATSKIRHRLDSSWL